MNRHDLATLIRDHILKHPDVESIEAQVENKSKTVRVRYWGRDKRLLAEVLRLLVCLSLNGCAIIAGLDGYVPPIPPADDDAGDVDAAPDVRGIEPHLEAGVDVVTDVDGGSCGDVDEACCLGQDRKPEICTAQSAACDGVGMCRHCGDLGELCCQGVCNAGLSCVAGSGSYCYALDGGGD